MFLAIYLERGRHSKWSPKVKVTITINRILLVITHLQEDFQITDQGHQMPIPVSVDYFLVSPLSNRKVVMVYKGPSAFCLISKCYFGNVKFRNIQWDSELHMTTTIAWYNLNQDLNKRSLRNQNKIHLTLSLQ